MVTVLEAQHNEHKARQLRFKQAAHIDYEIEPRGKSYDTVIKEVCRYYQVRPEDILSTRRFQNLARPRHIMMYLLCRMTKYNTNQIGPKVNRHPSTVLYAYNQVLKHLAKHQGDLDILEPRIKQLLPSW